MFSSGKINYLDFDIYSRRISFFYKNKEKIGSTFGFILTVLYIIISVVIFLIYFIKIIKRDEMTASDTTIYPNDIPSIYLNNDHFYIAFGLEHPTKLNRYIDEKIYYPKVLYIEKIKKNGEIIKVSETVLNVERCNIINFGDKYQKLFEKNELSDSYCIKDFNLTLIGSLKYNKTSYIEISIYPCVNNSENNNHCKSQNIIDTYLSSTYFSILAKDIGLNPYNYVSPTIPIIQDLYTSIDKSMKKEYILYFGITEINTDIGLFFNQYKKEIYLRYIKDFHNFNFIDDEQYKSGKEKILTTEIKLEDNIYLHKRTYTKMPQAFSITGGYMQIIYTIFSLIVLLSKKISIEKQLLNNLFNFNIKQRKIILCIEYEKKLDYNSSLDKDKEKKFIPYAARKSISIKNDKKRNTYLNMNVNKINKKISLLKKSDTGQNIIPSGIKEMISQNMISEDGFLEIFQKISIEKDKGNKEKEKNKQLINQSINRSKVNILSQGDNSVLNNLKAYRSQKNIKSRNNLNIFNNYGDFNKENNSIINFNLWDYYCRKKRREIELFNFAINFYKRQMDIINFFNIIILTQIMLTHQTDKKHNILSQKIELSIK